MIYSATCVGEQGHKNIDRYIDIKKEKNRQQGCIIHHYGARSHLSPEILTLHVWWSP